MYFVSLVLVLGSFIFAAPQYFGQVAHAAAPTLVQADQNDPDTALHTHDSTPTLTGATVGGTTVTVTVNSFTCVSPVVSSSWSCDGSFITTPLTPNVMYPIQMVATNNDGSITVVDSTGVIVDTIGPVISERVPVPLITNDDTPRYEFNVDSYGVITYAGGCSSGQTVANGPRQQVDFNHLNDGLYNNCTLYVTDSAGNQSNIINISPFTIDAAGPTGGLLTMKTNLFPAGLTVASPTAGIYILPALSMDGIDQFNSLSVIVTDSHLNTAATPDVYVDGVVNGKMVYNTLTNAWDYTGQTSVPNFSSGIHNLVATFSDTAGNTTTLTARFTTDNIPPTITLPADEVNPTLEATGLSTLFNFHPTVTDNVDPAPKLTSDTPAGSLFPLGATTVTWMATDSAGNTSTATQTVTIKDTTAPKFDPFNNISAEATSSTGAVVTFAPTATDVTGTPDVTCNPVSGSTFALGTTIVTCTAEDSSQNKSTMTFTVNIQDTTPPSISPVADIDWQATSASGATVTFTDPTATDLVDGNRVVTCNLPSGSTFPLGKTVVNCSAVDSHGNSLGVAFWVNVVDTISPTYSWVYPAINSAYKDGQSIYVEADITESGSGITDGENCNPAIHFPVGSFTGSVIYNAATGKCSGTITLTTPSYLNDGTQHITLNVSDKAGNSAISADRNIQIDNTAPTIGSIQNNGILWNIDFNFILTNVDWGISGKRSAQYRLDSVGGWQDFSEALPVGSWYGVTITDEGTHTLEYNLLDNAGNSNTGTVTVMLDKTAPIGGDLTWATANHPGGTTVTPVGGLYTITPPLKGEDTFTSLAMVVTDTNINTASAPVYIDDSATANGNMVYDVGSGTWNYVLGSPVSFSEGTHYLRATFSDLAGNSTTLTARFRTDRTAPTGGDLTWSTDFYSGVHTVTHDSNNLYVIPELFSFNDSNPAFSLIVNDNNLKLDNLDVYIDEVINGNLYYDSNAWYYENGAWSSLSEGTHYLSATFVDRTGYTTKLTVEITFDNTAPESSVGPLAEYINTKQFSINVTANDPDINAGNKQLGQPGSGVDYVELWYRKDHSVDGYTQYPGKFDPSKTIEFDTTKTGGDGFYEFYSIAVDKLGNREEVPYETSTFLRTSTVEADPEITPDTSTTVDTVAPVITLVGSSTMTLVNGATFSDPGATTDDGSTVVVTGVVNSSVPGNYTLAYNSTDAAGNKAKTVLRTVTVKSAPLPENASNLGSSGDTGWILGDQTTQQNTSNDNSTPGNTDVKGTSTTKNDTNNNNNTWSFLGLAWYWWILILAIVGGVAWWFFAGFRRREE